MSKSKLSTYRNCPYNFKLTYIDKLNEFDDEPEEGSPLKIGLEVHKIFEDYYDLPAARMIEEPYEKNITNLMYALPNAEKYEVHVDNFIKFNVEMIKRRGIENYIPEYRELRLHDNKHNFNGIIDRAEKIEDGYCVIDYKTGKPKALTQFLEELALYKYLFESTMNKPVIKVGIYFSKSGKLRTTELDSDDVESALYNMEAAREQIAKEVFPKRPSFPQLCNFCSNKLVCDLDLEL
jgi:RecB family exonuclease